MRPFVVILLCVLASVFAESQEQPGSADVGIYFLTVRATGGDDLLALITRTNIVLHKGCLRLGDEPDRTSYAVVWPSGFDYKKVNGVVHILNSGNRTVAKVGDSIRVSGGEVSQLSPRHFIQSVPGRIRCAGPFWIAGNDVTVVAP